ncbi:hypothetical protein OB13_17350 [Pontibacter sp. HJ8]
MALLLLSLSGCGKDDETPQPDASTLNKQITFNIYTETDYSDSRWDNSKMKLTLNLKRVSNNPHKETVVLDTTIGWMAFRDLPKAPAKAQFVKKLNSVSKENEDIVISISKLVSINGYESTFSHSLTVDRAKENEVVEVKL